MIEKQMNIFDLNEKKRHFKTTSSESTYHGGFV